MHIWQKMMSTIMDLRVSRGPPSGCTWGPAGCPGQSDASTQGRGPTPHTAPSCWCTAGHSRSGLWRPHWFLSLDHLKRRWPRSGRLYLLGERAGDGVGQSQAYSPVNPLVKRTDVLRWRLLRRRFMEQEVLGNSFVSAAMSQMNKL